MPYTLTFIDTVGIQNYIFGSNKLTHIMGASGLAHQATNDWVFQILIQLGATNVDLDGAIASSLRIEDGNLNSELIYAGGGNTLILFQQPNDAREFAHRLSHKALTEAPGLDLVITHSDFTLDPLNPDVSESLAQKLNSLIAQANLKKLNRKRSAPLAGLGITISCPYTGWPAVTRESYKDGLRISSETASKLAAKDYAEKRLKDAFTGLGELTFFDNFNQIPGDEKGSYLAIIHSDGTDMGKRIQRLLQSPETHGNRQSIEALRAFSSSIKVASDKALQATVSFLIKAINAGMAKNINQQLPFRPIVFGGDDVTFVCTGMLGLSLAAFHLIQLEEYLLSDKEPIYGRTGVAIVKSHFPFSQAYQLAVALCSSARKRAKELMENNEVKTAALDWQIFSSGPVSDLDRIRKRKYLSHDLLMRPLVVWGAAGGISEEWRTWQVFQALSRELQLNYQAKTSKLKGLLAVLPQGSKSYQDYILTNRLIMPEVTSAPDAKNVGWFMNRCVYHDALEAMEFFKDFG